MAKSDVKVNGSIKASKRSKVIMGLVVAVLICIVLGFFVYMTGILPRVLPGIKIVETNPQTGKTDTIANISVLEANFHYAQAYGTYSYSMGDKTVDDVYDPTTGKTYFQMILDQAASQALRTELIVREAEANGYAEHSGADNYAALSIESTRSYAEMYGFQTADQYLQATFGTGMSVNLYRQFTANQALADEYQQYRKQFVVNPTDEEITALFEENPFDYMTADVCYYYFPGTANDEGTYDLDEAEEKANAVAEATDVESFREILVETLGDEVAEGAGFVEGANPSYHENATKSTLLSIPEGGNEFIFDEANIGSTTVICNDYGAYVIFLEDCGVDEETVVSYRTLTLTNEVVANESKGVTVDEQAHGLIEVQARANELISAPMTSLEFADLVKDNSTNAQEIMSGGYVERDVASAYVSTEEAPVADSKIALGEWLFDESRVQGDTYVMTSGNTVTIYYFEDSMVSWENKARTSLINSSMSAWAESLYANNPLPYIAYELIDTMTY